MWPLPPRCHFESIPKVRRSQVLASLAGWLLTQTRTTINVDNVFGGGDDDDDDINGVTVLEVVPPLALRLH